MEEMREVFPEEVGFHLELECQVEFDLVEKGKEKTSQAK